MSSYRFLKKALLAFFLSLSFLGTSPALAEIDKPIAKVYPIQEISFVKAIMDKLAGMDKKGAIKKMEEEFKKKAIDSIENPRGISLPRATEESLHYYDPSIVVEKDLFLPNGTLMHKAGTKVNPLEIISLSKRYIFIDATDNEQVEWAKKQYKESGWRDKIILVKGSYRKIMKDWQQPVYFDQLGAIETGQKRKTLVDTFGVEKLPTVVEQDGLMLSVKSVVLK